MGTGEPTFNAFREFICMHLVDDGNRQALLLDDVNRMFTLKHFDSLQMLSRRLLFIGVENESIESADPGHESIGIGSLRPGGLGAVHGTHGDRVDYSTLPVVGGTAEDIFPLQKGILNNRQFTHLVKHQKGYIYAKVDFGRFSRQNTKMLFYPLSFCFQHN